MGTAEIDTTRMRSGLSRRLLPRGWRDLALQFVIWFGFLGLYQVVRGVADRDPAEAFANGLKVIHFERGAAGLLELTLQNLTETWHWLGTVAAWTYWNSEFTVVGLALLWVYLRRNEHFRSFRNWILFANVLGLIGYAVLPTAPPRMFPDFGFADSMAAMGSLNHGSGFVQLAANPYAAMPSLHSADAFIVGLSLAFLCRRWIFKIVWLAWPAWVWFCVMATANHFWLDVVAGIGVASLAFVLLRWGPPLVRGRLAPAVRGRLAA